MEAHHLSRLSSYLLQCHQPEMNISRCEQAGSEHCSFCKKYGIWERRCGNCLSCFYCSGNCQRNHWKQEHKLMCRHIKQYLKKDDEDSDTEGDTPPITPPTFKPYSSRRVATIRIHKSTITPTTLKSKIKSTRQNNTYPQILKTRTSEKLPLLVPKAKRRDASMVQFEADKFPRFKLQHAKTARKIHDAMAISKLNKQH